jgi:hypothetical protein
VKRNISIQKKREGKKDFFFFKSLVLKKSPISEKNLLPLHNVLFSFVVENSIFVRGNDNAECVSLSLS